MSHVDDKPFQGLEKRSDCSGCGAKIGERHKSGCDWERCSGCGMQRNSCGIRLRRNPTSPYDIDVEEVEPCKHDPDFVRFNGLYPGELEATVLRWFSKFTDRGWVGCEPSELGAGPDLNRWAYFMASGKDPGPPKGRE